LKVVNAARPVETTSSFINTSAESNGCENTTVSTIRNKAHYHGQLAIVDYYSIDYSSQGENTQRPIPRARPFEPGVTRARGALASRHAQA
jgi:hypothetical protein